MEQWKYLTFRNQDYHVCIATAKLKHVYAHLQCSCLVHLLTMACCHLLSTSMAVGAGAVEFVLCHAEVQIAFVEEKKIGEVCSFTVAFL